MFFEWRNRVSIEELLMWESSLQILYLNCLLKRAGGIVKKTMVRNNNSDSDDDETFYYRYPSTSNPTTTYSAATGSEPHKKKPKGGGGSGGLAPSKSTLYVSNLDYSLTNSDLHTLFSTFGKVARVTVLKDRATRISRGVAFIQFVSAADALSATRQMHGKVLNGRTVSASIAADNGRAPEFIRKREYKDKSRCYECGEGGHLSYECPRNQLGPRERPVPKRPRGGAAAQVKEVGLDDDEEAPAFDDENWASVVDNGADQRLLTMGESDGDKKKMKKGKKASYFSDESGDEDE
jgi:U11/U12 small nuclear ribonucleoprotein SNRNP31